MIWKVQTERKVSTTHIVEARTEAEAIELASWAPIYKAEKIRNDGSEVVKVELVVDPREEGFSS